MEAPHYSPSNPKLDFYCDGKYQFSSNWYKSVSHAEHYYPTYSIVIDRSAK